MHHRWKVCIERYQEVTVALSESVIIYCLKRPLAEKSRWCHIWLALKPRYLGNHASQMKSYHGTLLGSHSPSFRIRHEKLPEVPLSKKIMMTSFPACNQTSLARKPCIPDKTIPHGTLLGSHGPSFRMRHNILHEVPSSGEITMTSYPACNKTSLSWKPSITYKKLPWNTIRKSSPSFRIRHEKSPESLPSGEITMTSYPPCNETSLSRKPCIPDKKLLLNTISKSWSLFQNPSWKIAWSAPWRRNHDDVISYL